VSKKLCASNVALVTSAADFRHLNSVLLILDFGGSKPSQA